MYFWNTMNTANTGISERVPMAKIAPQSVDVMGSLNMRSARETVKLRGLFK
jgi:hypothetical protein